MNWLPNIRNIPELVALKTGRGDTISEQSSLGLMAGHTGIGRQVCIPNNEIDARFMPRTSLGKKISATKINDSLKVMRAKGNNLCLRNDGKQKCHTGHAKGFGYSLCSHQVDHEKRPTVEMNRFHEWCKEAFSE